MTATALAECLELVGKDLCEAHAADRMLSDMAMRCEGPSSCSDVRIGLTFVEHALALRMALAVNRTLQGSSRDKASFERLFSLARSTGRGTDMSGLEKRFQGLRIAQAASKLRDCRNGFMAHTLVREPGNRDGMDLRPISDLLYDVTDLYEDFHRVAVGTENRRLPEDLDKWRTRAKKTWDVLLGQLER